MEVNHLIVKTTVLLLIYNLATFKTFAAIVVEFINLNTTGTVNNSWHTSTIVDDSLSNSCTSKRTYKFNI